MTKTDMMNDYYFLEDSTNFLKQLKDNKSVKKQARTPQNLMKLKKIAFEKKVRLYYLTNEFSKRKLNRTHFNKQTNEIIWQLELIFPNAGDFQVNAKFNENDLLYDILDKVFNKTENENTLKQLEYYRSHGLKNLRVLLKAEGLKNCKNRYYELHLNKSLKQNLFNKIIIEYPSICITMNYCEGEFQIIDDDGIYLLHFLLLIIILTINSLILDKNLEAEMEQFRKSLQTEIFHKKDNMPRPDNKKRPGPPLPEAENSQKKKKDKELSCSESDDEEVKPENFLFSKNL